MSTIIWIVLYPIIIQKYLLRNFNKYFNNFSWPNSTIWSNITDTDYLKFDGFFILGSTHLPYNYSPVNLNCGLGWAQEHNNLIFLSNLLTGRIDSPALLFLINFKVHHSIVYHFIFPIIQKMSLLGVFNVYYP